MIYVADTHAVIWYLGGSPLLGAKARAALDSSLEGANTVAVPAIAIAELVMIAEKRRIVIDPLQIVATLRATPGFVLTPLSVDRALHIHKLTILPDIHDRLIVAEAIELRADLITRDQAIIASGLVDTIW